MPMLRLDGANLYYETYGQGEAIVFLPGLGCCMKAWAPQTDFFAEKYRVIYLDLRGHGKSEPGDQAFTMPLFAKDLKGLLDSLGINSAAVCGLSLGSLVAQQFAIDYPQSCMALILCGAHAHPGIKERFSGMLVPPVLKRYFRKKTPMDLATATAAKVFPKPGQEQIREFYAKEVISTTAEGYLKSWNAVALFDSYRYLESIKVPTLIYHGEEDDAFIRKQAMLFQKCIPHAVCKTMSDAGHIINLEKPDEFNRTVGDFLREHVH